MTLRKDKVEIEHSRVDLMRKWIIAIGLVFLLLLIILYGLGPKIRIMARNRTEKILQKQIESQVEFSDFEVSLLPRIHVTITGLVMRHKGRKDIPPLIQVREVSIYTDLLSLLRIKPRIAVVELDGLQIHTPPRPSTGQPLIQRTDQELAKYPVLIEEIRADDAIVVVLRTQPEKPGQEIPVHHLELHNVSLGRPAAFHAVLTNAVPAVEIDATGEFGPWQPDAPSETPAIGRYTFQNADLGTLKGLNGTLSSKGKFSGPLDYLTIDGATDIPDFSLRTADHPVALHTDFSAVVDGTNGNTYLNSVTARFLHTTLAVSGKVTDVNPEVKGRTIVLDATSQNARVEDLIRLAIKIDEPVITGFVRLRTKINITEGYSDLIERVKSEGQFGIGDAQFTSPAVQAKIDTLSRKGQGQPKDRNISSVVSEMKGNFRVSDGVATFSNLNFGVAGALLRLGGTYNLDSGELDFHGKLMLQAKLSRTTTGASSFSKGTGPIFQEEECGYSAGHPDYRNERQSQVRPRSWQRLE